ncbi:MAG: asparagine synthase C-terminal domain-containing protein [Candidatus Heimdallarchaeota archaeon]
METIIESLHQTIGTYLQQEDTVGLLYSGGLDSTVIAHILISQFPPSGVQAVSVGAPGSYDLNNALTMAAAINLPLSLCYLSERILIEAIADLRQLRIITNPGDLAIVIPLFLGMRTLVKIPKLKTVFLGQGADELFAGYKKYITLYTEQGMEATQKAMNHDFNKLMIQQTKIETKIADFFGLKPIYPYLDSRIVKYAQSQSISAHLHQMPGGVIIRKNILRKCAFKLGIPQKAILQPKKAMQYGSGTVKLLRRLAKSVGYRSVSEWFASDF